MTSARTRTSSIRATTEEAIVLAMFDVANHPQRRGELLAGTAQWTTQQWLVLLQIAGDRDARRHDHSHATDAVSR